MGEGPREKVRRRRYAGEGPSEKVCRRRSAGEDPREKVRWKVCGRRSAGEGAQEKVCGRRFVGEGLREKVYRRRSTREHIGPLEKVHGRSGCDRKTGWKGWLEKLAGKLALIPCEEKNNSLIFIN